jgi:hypothetical protein
MLTARRNLLKMMAALVMLPLSKLVRASPHEFNKSHAISYAMMAEMKKLTNEVEKALGDWDAPSEYVRLLKCENGTYDIAIVWKIPNSQRRTSTSTIFNATDWETAKQVGRTLKLRRKAGRLVLSKQVKNRIISISRDAQ